MESFKHHLIANDVRLFLKLWHQKEEEFSLHHEFVNF